MKFIYIKYFLIWLAILYKPAFAQQINPNAAENNLLYYYNSQLEKIEEEIAVEEAEYNVTLNSALLSSINKKKAKREILNIYGSKFAKKSSANLASLAFFSKMEVFLSKQKELEQKYDIKINLNADQETLEELKSLGITLGKTVSTNETSSKNRLINIIVHYYKDAFKISYKAVLSQPLSAEITSQEEIQEIYNMAASSGNSKLFTTDFIFLLESKISSLNLTLNPSNIAELEKLKNTDGTFSFMAPSGIPFTIPGTGLKSITFYFNDKTPNSTDILSFRADGALEGFTYEGNLTYEACYLKNQSNYFTGYGLSLDNSDVCAPNKFSDISSKNCSQRDSVIVATACMDKGILKFKAKKIRILQTVTWPASDHTGAGSYKSPLPVNYQNTGKTAEISDYTFLSKYSDDAREFLSKSSTCESKYVPYVVTIANFINTIPAVYKKCYSKKWFIDNFALFECAQCTTGHFDKYAARVASFRNRLNQMGNSAITPATNSAITTLTNASDLYDYISDYTYCDYGYLTIQQQNHILKTLAATTIKDDYERIFLSLMGAMEENPEKINDFLNSLIDPQNYVNGKAILHRLFDDFDDLNDNAYTSLVTKISSLVARSTLPNLEFPDYSVYSNYYPDKRIFVLDYNCYDETNPSETSSCNGNWLPGFTRYKKIDMLTSGSMLVDFKTKGTYPQQNGNGAIYYNYTSDTYTLHPYQLISFTDNEDIEEVSQFSIGDGKTVIMPACFLEYAMYAKFKHTTWKNVAIAGDIVLMAVGVGEVCVAAKAFRSAGVINKIISGARVGWGAAQAAGGVMDLSIRMSNDVDPEFKGFVEKYNMAIVILSLPSVYTGLAQLANGTLKLANKTYNGVAYLITEQRALLTTEKLLQKELLARLVLYNIKLNEANTVKLLQNQALLAESNYLTNNYIKIFHKAAYDEAFATKSAYILKEGYLIERFVAKTGEELNSYLNSLATKPVGKTHNGNLYKSLKKTSEANHNAKPDIISDFSVEESWGRYDTPGESAMYYSETFTGNQTEMAIYGAWESYSTYEYTGVQFNNLLDLTNDEIRIHLGTRFDDLTRSFIESTEILTKSKNYEMTNVLGTWARSNGYTGIIVPGARGSKNYSNFIIFNQSDLNAALLNHTPIPLK